MEYKKIVKYWFFVMICFMLILPMINILNYRNIKSIENLYNLDRIESFFNYVAIKLFEISLPMEKTILGKDGFLFTGNRYENNILKQQNLYFVKEEEIQNYISSFKKLQEFYESKGIKFLIIVAPAKSSIYPERLPSWIIQPKKTFNDILINKMKENGIKIFSLKQYLLESKLKYKNDLFYFRADDHWNRLGALLAYYKSIDILNSIYNQNYKKVYTDFKKIDNLKRRGSFKLLKIEGMFPLSYDHDYEYTFNKNNVKIGKINSNTKNLSKSYKVQKNPRLFTNSSYKYMINENALNSQKLLYLCDSYSEAGSQLYNETFNTIFKLHYKYLYGQQLQEFVNKNKPDIVIYQIVERNLFLFNMIKDIDKI